MLTIKQKAKILSNSYHTVGHPFLHLVPINFTVGAGKQAKVRQIVYTRM